MHSICSDPTHQQSLHPSNNHLSLINMIPKALRYRCITIPKFQQTIYDFQSFDSKASRNVFAIRSSSSVDTTHSFHSTKAGLSTYRATISLPNCSGTVATREDDDDEGDLLLSPSFSYNVVVSMSRLTFDYGLVTSEIVSVEADVLKASVSLLLLLSWLVDLSLGVILHKNLLKSPSSLTGTSALKYLLPIAILLPSFSLTSCSIFKACCNVIPSGISFNSKPICSAWSIITSSTLLPFPLNGTHCT
mmetsp:Transcript_255/g.382  ORF Transcript_255/g.382 Transcript_255/m.382 type:complete len:247 (+) Transcript_255:70-810(+)